MSSGGGGKKRVAVVGGGVSGLCAAWHLHSNADDVEVEVFEGEERLGGHAHTVRVEAGVDVDIGFMVFNDANYPHMTRWFERLGVESEDSDMSLSVSLSTQLEWSSCNPFSLLRIWMRPRFAVCLADMVRFHHTATRILHLPPDHPHRSLTTVQYLRAHNYSTQFAACYLLPMMAALWSASIDDVLQFPAHQLIAFLHNHHMLQLFRRPQWKTVRDRSQSYTTKMKALLGERHLRLSTPVESIDRLQQQQQHDDDDDGQQECVYELFTTRRKSLGTFHHIIFACHPPTTARLLRTMSDSSQRPQDLLLLTETLSQIQYADNVVYLHSDPSFMPHRESNWASWNCIGDYSELSSSFTTSHGTTNQRLTKKKEDTCSLKRNEEEETKTTMSKAHVTYWLNRLQNLDSDTNLFVTLNPNTPPNDDMVYKRQIMSHPQFTLDTIDAVQQINDRFQGKDGLWFCGAWSGYGFHEDGCRSGFRVATTLSNIPLPWTTTDNNSMMVALHPVTKNLPKCHPRTANTPMNAIYRLYKTLTYHIPVILCRRIITSFLQKAITRGSLHIKLTDGTLLQFGDGSRCGSMDDCPVTIQVLEDWFFVRVALEYDLGMARSYMMGYFVVEPLSDPTRYDIALKPHNTREESNALLGDPIGLTRLFLLLIGNRDATFSPKKSARAHSYGNAFSNASGLFISKLGSFLHYVRYCLRMNNSERGGSLKNIHAHYDLSNDLFTSFLDEETLMYSSAIYDAIPNPITDRGGGLLFRGSLEEAQRRKLDTLLWRAQVKPGMTLLDIGFGWGGLSIHAAKKYGCIVTGITLSIEQMTLAQRRVNDAGLNHLITLKVMDYRTFARNKEHHGSFDRVISCEMIEAVGHDHLGEFFWAVEQVLTVNGILVMEAITTPEARYETYRRSTDLINTMIFPGSCCPSLHALIDAAYEQSTFTLEHVDNIGLHYAQTLAEWRRRFNGSAGDNNVDDGRWWKNDDKFQRLWNYYFTYCEAGFYSQTEHCLILVFTRPGNQTYLPPIPHINNDNEVSMTKSWTMDEINTWLTEQ